LNLVADCCPQETDVESFAAHLHGDCRELWFSDALAHYRIIYIADADSSGLVQDAL